jgi:putative flippase GtrA
MKFSLNRKERARFIKFALVGIIGAIVDFGIMNLLTRLIFISLVLAGSISFICAVTSNFLWNRFWVYPDSRSRPAFSQLAMFFFVNLIGAGIRIPILWYLEPPLYSLLNRGFLRPPLSADFIAKNVTLAVVVGIVMLWNFFVNRYWTYNDVSS